MPVNLNQYRGTVGVFNNQKFIISKAKSVYSSTLFRNFDSSFVLFLFCVVLIEIVSFKNTLNVIVSGTVKRSIKDVCTNLLRVLRFIFKIMYNLFGIFFMYQMPVEILNKIQDANLITAKTFSIYNWNPTRLTAHCT